MTGGGRRAWTKEKAVDEGRSPQGTIRRVRMTRPGLRPGRLMLLVTLALAPRRARADWAPDGNPLTQAPASQSAPLVIPDGAGGAITVWLDSRLAPNINAFGQHITGLGLIAPGWT